MLPSRRQVLAGPSTGARPYSPAVAYGQSKTATALFAVEAQRRWSADGVTANAVHPGPIKTNLGRHLSAEAQAALPDFDYRTAEQGAATPTLLATCSTWKAGRNVLREVPPGRT